MFLIVLSSLLLAITLFGKRLLSDEVTSLPRLKRHNTPPHRPEKIGLCTILSPILQFIRIFFLLLLVEVRKNNNEL